MVDIKGLVKKANDKTSWKARIKALHEIKEIDCQERIDVITRLALHDKVYEVMHEAFLAAQQLGIQKNGKPIALRKKDIGFKSSDFTKTFLRIKRETKMQELDLSTFKEKFKCINPEMYDVMNYEKAEQFDKWITSVYAYLPKKKA